MLLKLPLLHTMPLNQVLEAFANTTSMHGLPKVIHSRSTLSRIFWAIVCVSAGAMFTMQMSEVLQRYFSFPKKVTVEVVPMSVPFPAISMCNMRNLDFHILNTLNRKFLEDHEPRNHLNTSDHPFISEYMKTVAKYAPLWYQYQSMYPDVFQEVFSRTTFSSNIPEDVISIAAVQAREFVVDCHYGGNSCNLTRDFEQFFDPYYFNCFTYTSTPSAAASSSASSSSENNGGKSSSPPPVEMSLSEGIENGWSSILFSGSGMLDKNSEIRVLPGLHESSSPISASEGVRVVIHLPDTEPFPFTEGYDVPPGFSASLGIKPRKNLRIGPPHGKCAERNPFTPDAKQHYRSISCQKMCLQNHIIESCNCTNLSLPKVPQRGDVKSCRNLDSFPDSCIFNATEQCLNELLQLSERVHCARRAREAVTRNNMLVEECACHPPCKEVLYDVSYSLSKWPATGYEGDAAYMDVFYIVNFTDRFHGNPAKFETVNFNDTLRETRMKDFARLNVYIADSNVIKTAETPDYNTNQLVSDIGGQLGLWVGISIITLTEVMELLCNILAFFFTTKVNNSSHCSNSRKKKKQSTTLANKVTTFGARPSSYNNGNYCTMVARGAEDEGGGEEREQGRRWDNTANNKNNNAVGANTNNAAVAAGEQQQGADGGGGDRYVMTFTPRTYTPGNRYCDKPPKRSKQLF